MDAMHYLDANATEPLRPARSARAAVLAALDGTGNPSSVHAAGRAARRIVETARTSLAAHFGGRAQDLVFTSGATEANALAIHALAGGKDRFRPRVIVGATEHDAVRAAAPDATVLPVDAPVPRQAPGPSVKTPASAAPRPAAGSPSL